MRFLLGTNVCVDYLTGRYPSVTRRLRQSSPEDLCLSPVVVAELRYGAEKSGNPRRNHERLDVFLAEIPCEHFDSAAASLSGRIRAELERQGSPVGPYDMLIAAHAMALGLVLVTDNVREFSRIKDLRIENWRDENTPP